MSSNPDHISRFLQVLKRSGRILLFGVFFIVFLSAISIAQQRTDANASSPDSVSEVSLEARLIGTEEVVTTALGSKKEKRQVTFSAQNVETKNISQAQELNSLNSLQGRVAGMDLMKSSSGLGSATRVVLRGNRSIAGNNQPLYILDGVPINNSSFGVANSGYGGVQSGDGIGNINPDDIESITILKGPNAAALYGSRAANGAVVITTRKGIAGKGIGVEFNTNTSIDKALILTKFQHVYGQGVFGNYEKTSEASWGPKMDGQMVEHWTKDPSRAGETYAFSPHNNFEEFFQTGINTANSLTLTGGSDKIRSIFSYTSTNARGIVETNELKRNNFNVRVDGNLSDKLSFDAKLTYFNQKVNNRLSTGDDYSNPMRALYRQPSNISLEQVRRYEYFDENGERWQDYWRWPTYGGENVYWMLYRGSLTEEDRNRILGVGSIRYEFTKGLSFMVRSAFDQVFEHQETKRYNWTYTIADAGYFGSSDNHAMEVNTDALLNYNHKFSDLLSLNVSTGGNMLYVRSDSRNMGTNRLLKPNFFTIANTSQIQARNNLSEKKINSAYAFATIGLKDFLFLDVTARNDWSSTLPKKNWSYFYPSVGLTVVLTDMIENTPDFLSFAKLRASYAEVGNETSPYAIHNTYFFGAGGSYGYAGRNYRLAAMDLKPENTKSTELGFDFRFFRNRLGIDLTWYKSNTFNQLIWVPVPIASGSSSKYINAGNIQNKGIEVIANVTPVMAGDFRWDVMVNYARNKNLCIKLTDNLEEYTIRGRSYYTTHKMVVGESHNQIFTKGFIRNEEGRLLINTLGWPMAGPGQTVMQGSPNPDWTGGMANSISWKGFNLSALVDMRMGGIVLSMTEAELTMNGLSETTLEGRDGFVVDGLKDDQDYSANPDGDPIWVENDIVITAEEYWFTAGGRSSPVGESSIYDASYVRLREVLLGYTWNLKVSQIQSIGFSLYGRNLGFLYNASGILDPGMSMGVGNIQGVEGFSIPTSSTYGVNVRVRF